MNMALNVLGTELSVCCSNPVTGFYRNGKCDTGPEDLGMHTVCIIATKEFLEFSLSVGNDLSTPIPAYEFPGLAPGDKWCLCLTRWIQALEYGSAPKVDLSGIHISTLEHIDLATLKKYSL